MKNKALKIVLGLFLGVVLLFGGLYGLTWFTTFHPKEPTQLEVDHCPQNAPVLKAGQKIKVLSWNVQYMASKNYIFFYDREHGVGPDIRPSKKDITKTFGEVARIIKAEKPDVVILQEMTDGAKNTDYENQLTRLRKMVSSDYSCYSSAFYWKAAFVPHPKIMGSSGMKLSTLSKYKITKSIRHALPIIPSDPFSELFGFRRTIQESYLPVQGGKDFVLLNTHLDAFAQGSNTMERQIQIVQNILTKLDDKKHPWVIGGDFNLLPPNVDRNKLKEGKSYYNDHSELSKIFKKFNSAATLADLTGADRAKHYTHYPNTKLVNGPDRTIDYLFYGRSLKFDNYYVRQKDSLHISDHLPMIMNATLPE
ncbi:MAG: endonuclease/exonuclease/phosphatase family metal-dependent hydrolase [bacterium]|jgi:endonuclease/exonuclease/phosphatase family metal-dependent hydrolase